VAELQVRDLLRLRGKHLEHIRDYLFSTGINETGPRILATLTLEHLIQSRNHTVTNVTIKKNINEKIGKMAILTKHNILT
jgi:dihydroorotase